MSGHPSYTSLAPALRNLGTTLGSTTTEPQREPQEPLASSEWWSHVRDWHDMLPRTFHRQGATTGSQGGTEETESEAVTKNERLFTTVDELFFTSERTKNGTGTQAPQLTQEGLRAARFVLTEHSRAPDLNPFNRPKISLWPVQASTTEQNEVDKAMIAAS